MFNFLLTCAALSYFYQRQRWVCVWLQHETATVARVAATTTTTAVLSSWSRYGLAWNTGASSSTGVPALVPLPAASIRPAVYTPQRRVHLSYTPSSLTVQTVPLASFFYGLPSLFASPKLPLPQLLPQRVSLTFSSNLLSPKVTVSGP
jgi:hypothetical protein